MEMAKYIQTMQHNPDWLPGKDALINIIEKHCGDVLPSFIDIHEIPVKNTVLDGMFVYKCNDDCTRITTCGLTQISPNEYAFGRTRSGWGAELSIALHTPNETCELLCMKMLARLAQYVNIRKAMYAEYDCISLNRIVKPGSFSDNEITGIVFTPDVEFDSIDTVHGRVSFLQVVGVSGYDWKKIKKTPTLARQYVFELGRHTPCLCLDHHEKMNVFE